MRGEPVYLVRVPARSVLEPIFAVPQQRSCRVHPFRSPAEEGLPALWLTFANTLYCMSTESAARRWRDVWQRAWAARATEDIVALYATDAIVQSHPFRPEQSPREYIQPTLAEETSVTCQFGEPIVGGDRAAVDWHAETVLRDGTTEQLSGVSLLRFNPEGQVVDRARRLGERQRGE